MKAKTTSEYHAAIAKTTRADITAERTPLEKAAPDLLAACKLALPVAESQEGGLFNHRGDMAAIALRAAIAKATS